MLQWTAQLVDHHKVQIKARLDLAENDGRDARLRFALSQISDLEKSATGTESLERFIYIVSALVHHERSGGLSLTQVDKLLELAYAILQIQGITPSKSRLAFLFGELHLVRSQIYRSEGDHWRAAWEQQVGHKLSKPSPPGGTGFQHLSFALRSVRLGQAATALHHLDLAGDFELTANQQFRVELEKARINRLVHSFEVAESIIEGSLFDKTCPQSFRREFEWEALLNSFATSREFMPIIAAVSKGGTHYTASYILEAKLICFCQPTKEYIARIASMKTLSRNKDIHPQKMGSLYKAITTIEDCYDTEIPLILRLHRLGETLSRLNELLTIDKELMTLAAASRFLARSKSLALANLSLQEYRSLSEKLCSSRSKDALGLTSDLQEKPWFI